MGLAADLGYRYSPPNVFQRAMQAVGSTRGGAWAFSHSLRHVDRLMYKATGGRRSAPEILAGLPVVMVTTTGRKSGQPRTTPLIAPPVGDTLALVGTNFGQRSTPAWVLNLEADPRASVEFRGTTRSVAARPATDDEATEIWHRAAAVYGGYDKYQERIERRAAAPRRSRPTIRSILAPLRSNTARSDGSARLTAHLPGREVRLFVLDPG